MSMSLSMSMSYGPRSAQAQAQAQAQAPPGGVKEGGTSCEKECTLPLLAGWMFFLLPRQSCTCTH
jgi:hypothetical protein